MCTWQEGGLGAPLSLSCACPGSSVNSNSFLHGPHPTSLSLPWTPEHSVDVPGGFVPPRAWPQQVPTLVFIPHICPAPALLCLPRIPFVIRNGNSRLGTFNNGTQRNACKAKLLHLHCLGIFLHIIKIRIFALPFSPCSPPRCSFGEGECRAPWVGSVTH